MTVQARHDPIDTGGGSDPTTLIKEGKKKKKLLLKLRWYTKMHLRNIADTEKVRQINRGCIREKGVTER